MPDFTDKLDLALLQIYETYLGSRETEAVERSPTVYNLSLHYIGDLAEIERLGFRITWNELEGFAHGLVSLSDIERIASHLSVISLKYGNPRKPRLDKSAPDIRARADTSANIGVNGLWFVDPATGNLAAGSQVTGENVVVGVIDTGIDIDHPCFMRSLSPFATRIIRIWDQGLDPIPAQGEKGPDTSLLTVSQTYGVEFTATMIDNYLNNLIPPNFRHRDCGGHGTHVAATAAGNGNPGPGVPLSGAPPTFDFVGIAPKADIIAVKYLDVKDNIRDTAGNVVSAETRLHDAFMYILKTARSLPGGTKPAAINCSFGSSIGPHDGLSDEEQFLDKLFAPGGTYSQGSIVVFSAGNDGASQQHATITIPASGEIVVPFELFDERGPHTQDYVECAWKDNTEDLYVDIWYKEVTVPSDVSVAVRVPTESTFSNEVFNGYLEKTFDGNKYRKIEHHEIPAVHRPNPPGSPVSVRRNEITLTVKPNRRVSPARHRTGIYEIRIKGPQGTVLHAWTDQQGPLGFRVGPQTTLMDDAVTGDTDLEVLSTRYFQTGDDVIIELNDGTQHRTTVTGITPGFPHILSIAVGLPSDADSEKLVLKGLPGEIVVEDRFLIGPDAGASNVISVAAYDDKNGDIADSGYANIADFSSRGPLVDYSGVGPLSDKPDIAAPGVDIHAAQSRNKDGSPLLLSELFGNRFIDMSGTSMAAPHITGLVALLLQHDSTLAVADVRTIFSNSANDRDGTRPTPADGADYQTAYGGGMVDAKKAFDTLP